MTDHRFAPFIIDYKFNSKLLVLEEIGGHYYVIIKIITKKYGEVYLPKYVRKNYINRYNNRNYGEGEIEQIHKEYIEFLLADFL